MPLSDLKKLKDKLRAVEEGKDLPLVMPEQEKGGRGGKAGGRHLIELHRPVVIDENSGPIEFLVSRGEMESGKDAEGMGGARFHTALRFRDLMRGAQVKGLKSADLESTGGGGMSTAAHISGYQLDCMRLVGKIREGMPKPWVFEFLELVVWRDEWFDLWPEWTGNQVERRKRQEKREKTLRTLHFALDLAALSLGYLEEEEFRRRWKARSPAPSPEVRRRIRVSRA